MISAGIDIGSRSVKCAVVENGHVTATTKADTGTDPGGQARKLLAGLTYDRVLATGYGRHLLEPTSKTETVTEIRAHARGARHFFPQAMTVLDIGGQDSKVIRLDRDGRVIRFEMNDRCAAGTGKFLEIMALALGFSISTFGQAAEKAKTALEINSMCAVFAESEVTSFVARGEKAEEIARGLHGAVVRRAVAMLNRVSSDSPLVFTGGVANNRFLVSLLEQAVLRPVLVSSNPEMTGAIGAALIAADR